MVLRWCSAESQLPVLTVAVRWFSYMPLAFFSRLYKFSLNHLSFLYRPIWLTIWLTPKKRSSVIRENEMRVGDRISSKKLSVNFLKQSPLTRVINDTCIFNSLSGFFLSHRLENKISGCEVSNWRATCNTYRLNQHRKMFSLYTVYWRVKYLEFISLNKTNKLAFVMLMKCVFREVGDKLLSTVYSKFRVQNIIVLRCRHFMWSWCWVESLRSGRLPILL